MIHIVYSGPCEYNSQQRGMAEHTLAYDGSCPLRTAQRWAAEHVGYRLYSVVCNGTVYMSGN